MSLSERFAVSVANEQTTHDVDESMLVDGARAVLGESEFSSAEISLAIVDDPTIHELNRQYLNHDYPTDVLSFLLDDGNGHLEGEVIISADTAASKAAEIGWPSTAEQLLYVIHGILHLVGYRDKSPTERDEMRGAETRFLHRFGFRQPAQGSER